MSIRIQTTDYRTIAEFDSGDRRSDYRAAVAEARRLKRPDVGIDLPLDDLGVGDTIHVVPATLVLVNDDDEVEAYV